MNMKLTMKYHKVPEGYIGYVEELPGANSQGATLDDIKRNLLEAVEMVFEANRYLSSLESNGTFEFTEELEFISQ